MGKILKKKLGLALVLLMTMLVLVSGNAQGEFRRNHYLWSQQWEQHLESRVPIFWML